MGIFLMFIIVSLKSTPVHAFNPATHIFIAERVFPESSHKIELYYGSIAPDLALYAPERKWLTAFHDTHKDFIDFSPAALSPAQEAFAQGWLTHNEGWGADHYAHIDPGYLIIKAETLIKVAENHLRIDLHPEFAQFAVEVAVDVLLKNDDAKLGEKLVEANLFRSQEDRKLLIDVLVDKERKTDWVTLASKELTFRNLVGRYATALALPTPQDKEALAQLGVQLAQEMYGITDFTKEQLLGLLNAAIDLCGDYRGIIDLAIAGINKRKNNLP
jgi:hypothetical protein